MLACSGVPKFCDFQPPRVTAVVTTASQDCTLLRAALSRPFSASSREAGILVEAPTISRTFGSVLVWS